MWFYKGEQFTEEILDDNIGFVYIITNLVTMRQYIGKKLFTAAKTKLVKGKKKRTRVASDWEKYYGSNDELKADVKELGPDFFRREILHLCKGKGECNYLELKEQCLRGALESDRFYNSWITVRVHKAHLKRLTSTIVTTPTGTNS